MALKNLTENEMVEVSSAWLDPQRGGAALDAYPLLAALRSAVQGIGDPTPQPFWHESARVYITPFYQ